MDTENKFYFVFDEYCITYHNGNLKTFLADYFVLVTLYF